MNKNVRLLLIALISFTFFNDAYSQGRTNGKSQEIELGKVSWLRDYDEACDLSKSLNKPILILFQEVPGCATCRNYGKNVLSNPLLVEAIEDQFIPLVIHNNKGGKDRETLNYFKEPSWNNPVVRIVDETGTDLTPRVSGNYSDRGLYQAMESALNKTYAEIPEYMIILGEELGISVRSQERHYSMYCFWTGEKELGGVDGVLETEAGFMKGREVVKVNFDKSKISENELDAFARKNNFTPISKDTSYRQATQDEDYYLRRSPYKYVALSPLQRTKVNSAIGKRKDASVYLSPRQKAWLKAIKSPKTKKDVLYDKDLASVWDKMD